MKKFIPTKYYKSIYTINYNKLKEEHIKCLLFDLDNTCLPYPQKVPTEELLNLFNTLKKDFKVIIYSNTTKKRLVNFINKDIEVNYLSKKPSTKGIIKIMKKYFYRKDEVYLIGDQLFTDVLGANRTGIKSILVDPLGKKDFIFTKFSRLCEQIVFKILKNKKILVRGEYNE